MVGRSTVVLLADGYQHDRIHDHAAVGLGSDSRDRHQVPPTHTLRALSQSPDARRDLDVLVNRHLEVRFMFAIEYRVYEGHRSHSLRQRCIVRHGRAEERDQIAVAYDERALMTFGSRYRCARP